MEKNPHTNPMGTVAQTTVGEPKGPRPGAPLAAPQGGGFPNPGVIIRRALAHWPVAAVVMVLGALATAQVIRMRKPIYKSETVIFYRPGVLSGDNAPPTDVLRTLGAKLKETLFAQSNLKKVLDETHLYKDVLDKRGYADAVDVFRKNIEFKARSNDTFAISFQGSSRDEAQDVTSRLADMIVEENAKSRQERAKETTEFLEAEKKRGDEDLAKLELDLAQFSADHPEFVTDSSGRAGAAVRAEQKKVGAAAAAQLQDARRRAAATGVSQGKAVVPGVPSPNAAPPVDPVLLAARTQAMTELIAAKRDLDDKKLRFTDQHPDVRAAEARVNAAEAEVQKREEAIRAAAPPPPPPAPVVAPPEDPTTKPTARKPTVAGAPDTTKPKAPEKAPESTLVTLETEWARLNREATKLRQQQQQLETKVFQAQMAASSEIGGYSATISILDPAFKPAGPSGTPNRIIILGGFAGSLIFGLILAVARGLFLDDRLFDASEIDGLGLVPVLGIVPRQKPEKKAKTRGAVLKAARSGNSATSSSFASLERSLDRTIEFLTRREGTAEAKALLIEARRLRSVVANWGSIPPAPDVHDEMLDRVLLLSTQAGAAHPNTEEDDDLKTEIDPGLGGMLDEQTVVAPTPIVNEDTEVYALDFEPRLYTLEQGVPSGPVAAPAPKAAAPAPQQRAPAPAERPVAFAAYPPMASAGGQEYPGYAPAQASPYAAYPPASEPSEPYPPLQGYPPVDAYAPEPRAAYPSSSSPAYPPAPYPGVPAAGVTPTTGRRAAEEPPVNDAPLAPETAITVIPAKLAEKIEPHLVLLSEPYSDRADVYRTLRRKLAASSNPRVIAITSPGPGEGKTTTAINLALAMREGARGKVLLLEANVRAPGISKVLGFEPPACFAEQIVSHREDPRQPWIVAEPLAQLHVLAVDPKITHSPLLDPVAFTSAMERLKRAGYEYIIVDTPPVIGSFEVNMIADTVDGVLFSAITMKSKKSAIKKAIEQVMPAPVLGAIVLDT